MDRNPEVSGTRPRRPSITTVTNHAPAWLRLLVWPCAVVHAAQQFAAPGGVAVPAVAATLALLTAWAASRRDALAWVDAIALALELALATVVVALTGGAGSPWLSLYPALMLDRWQRNTLRLAVPGVAVAYAVALFASPGTAAVSMAASQASLFLLLAVLCFRAGLPARGAQAGPASEAAETEHGLPGAFLLRVLEDVSGILGRQVAESGEPEPQALAAPRALSRTLNRLLGAGSSRRAELTYRRFRLARLAEERATAWAAVAHRHGHDIYLHVASSTPDRRFGDDDRLGAILDLMLLAGCYGPRDGRVKVSIAPGAECEGEVVVSLSDAPGGLSGRGARALLASLQALAHEMGGTWTDSATSGHWTFTLPVDCQEGRAEAAQPALSGIAVHVTGDSPLAPVLRDYLAAEGARVEPDPARAALTLLAEDARGGDAELRCREFRRRHPGARLVCQGITGGVAGGVLLEADGILPMPLTRREFVRVVREHAADTPVASRKPVPVAAPEAPRPGAVDGAATVLVAEDDAISARVVTRFLEAEGVSVRRVSNGEAALRALMDGDVRIGLLDMHMPGMSGVEVARELRARERHDSRPRIPLLALTASAAEEDRRACEDAGMDDFLSKPVERDTLRRLLRRYLPAGQD